MSSKAQNLSASYSELLNMKGRKVVAEIRSGGKIRGMLEEVNTRTLSVGGSDSTLEILSSFKIEGDVYKADTIDSINLA